MKRVMIFLAILSLLLVCGISGCEKTQECSGTDETCSTFPPGERVTDADFAYSECEKLCNDAIKTKLGSSKCLGDPLSDSNWVCDIAHSPRIPEDNLPENQCQAFLNGTSKRFIELTHECRFIRMG